jgi:hypothetical protein
LEQKDIELVLSIEKNPRKNEAFGIGVGEDSRY